MSGVSGQVAFELSPHMALSLSPGRLGLPGGASLWPWGPSSYGVKEAALLS